MRITTLIALTLALSVLNSGCDSEPGTAEVNNPVATISEPSTTEMSAEDQNNIGKAYYYGLGVPQDHEEAVKWHRLAAEQGNATGQLHLGRSYKKGQGVPQDYKEAVKWYRLAAEQGLAVAQNNLGISYDEGKGVPQDHQEAYIWVSLAYANDGGNELHKKNLALIKAKLSPEQLAEAQSRATELHKQIEAQQ